MQADNKQFIYSPESGEPISDAEWAKFQKALQGLLEKHFMGTGEQIVLDAVTLGKLLNKMAHTQTKEQIDKKRLADLEADGHNFDWIAQSVQNMATATGEPLTGEQMARVQLAQKYTAALVTKVSDAMRNSIKEVIIGGIINKESRSVVSQKLFDKMQGFTRDFMRIADTETQNNLNWANVATEVNRNEGKETYFRRVEIIDRHTCPKCRALNGKIALYTKGELPDDSPADMTIFEGEPNMGTIHPYCRGLWMPIEKERIEAERKKEAEKQENK